MKKQVVLYPQYLKEFKCSGSSCEDHCCKDWNIHIEKTVYDTYINSSHKLLSDKDNYIFSQDGNSAYARIKLNPQTNMCPFLDEHNLCNIHKELGHHNLGSICRNYPRKYLDNDGDIEVSLSTSCIEAAKLILTSKNGIPFETGELDIDDTLHISKLHLNNNDLIHHYFWPIRTLAINLMNDRTLSLDDKLVVLGMLVSKLEKCTSTHELDKLIRDHEEGLHLGRYNNISSKVIPKNTDNLFIEQLYILLHLQMSTVTPSAISSSYRTATAFIANQFGNPQSQETEVENLKLFYKSNVKHFINENEYIIENYITNQLFYTAFPIDPNTDSIYQQFIATVVRVGLIKLNIALYCLQGQDLTLDNSIKIISAISKELDHNKLLNKALIQRIESIGANSLANLIALSTI